MLIPSLHILSAPVDRLINFCVCWWKHPVQTAFTDLWYVVVPPLSLLLLQFDGDASDWTPLDPLHQMCHISASNRQRFHRTNNTNNQHGSALALWPIIFSKCWLSRSTRVWKEQTILQTRERLAVFFFLYYQWPGYKDASITFDTGRPAFSPELTRRSCCGASCWGWWRSPHTPSYWCGSRYPAGCNISQWWPWRPSSPSWSWLVPARQPHITDSDQHA